MEDSIGIIGAGLAGSMTAILLSNLGFTVNLFEKRTDPRYVLDKSISFGNNVFHSNKLHGINTSVHGIKVCVHGINSSVHGINSIVHGTHS